MRTVTSRKELIAGIKAGERHFKVKGKSLLLQCAIASKFNGADNVTRPQIESVASAVGAKAAISGGVLIALTATAVVGAIAIIAILKNKHLKIRIKTGKDGNGEIEGEMEIF